MMRSRWWSCSTVLAGLLVAGAAFADGGVKFHDVAAGGANGLSYSRVPSARIAISDAIRADGVLTVDPEYWGSPFKPHGAPGVAVFDYDGDGDQDIYVTNGPGKANSLFKNLLRQTGQLRFVDVAAAAGVAATSQDSQGVCYGDIDNDGDEDLMVLGSSESNLLFENRGNGTFRNITTPSHAGGTTYSSVSCTMGDVNGDGLLDIYIANAFDFIKTDLFVIGPYFVYHQPDQLLLNQGHNSFADVSDSSGVRNIAGLSEPGAPMVSWGTTMVDYDQDGDLDILVTHDQRSVVGLDPQAFPRFFSNDGTGHFTDATASLNMTFDGSWRGLSVADLDCNSRLDLFAANIGDYVFLPGFFAPGEHASRWFLQQGNGTFTEPGLGALATIPGGWGTSMVDYDNDGDFDIVDYGNEEWSLFWELSNPGVILQNQGRCSGQFGWDAAALTGSTNHTRRVVQGLATGDLNADGFPDIVSVASMILGNEVPLEPDFSAPLGSPFDATAFFAWNYFFTDDPNVFAWTGATPRQGTLSVEINNGANHNHSIAVDTLGTVGITNRGVVNRDGIGAIVSVRPLGGVTAAKPVLGGSSYASQDSLELLFGLGNASLARIDVLWPGGVRNRLYGAVASERILFPEIPCSFAGSWHNLAEYTGCVTGELARLGQAGVLNPLEQTRFFLSALQAYHEQHGF